MTGEPGGLTYPEVGATRDGPLPAGYRHLHYRTRLGDGATVMAAATRALLGWRMHEAMGVRVRASSPQAAAGVTVLTRPGLGPAVPLLQRAYAYRCGAVQRRLAITLDSRPDAGR